MTPQSKKDPSERLWLYRLIQWIFVLDMALGAGLQYFAGDIAGDDFDLAGAVYIAGLGLLIAGLIGFVIFSLLARSARRRAREQSDR